MTGVERRPGAAHARGVSALALLVLAGAVLGGCGRQQASEGARASRAGAGGASALQIGAPPGALTAQTLDEVHGKSGLQLQHQAVASQSELERRLLAGGSGFDLVVVPSQFIARQVRAGLFQKLDKRQLPNLEQVDADLMAQLSASDPGNELAVPYRHRTVGIAVDRQQFAALMGDADPLDWSMVFDAGRAAKFAGCGLYLPDAPQEIVGLALVWLGRDPNSERSEDLAAAAAALRAIKPYVRLVDPSRLPQELARTKPCLAVADADAVPRGERGAVVDYGIPVQGTIAWFDVLAIPADARQARNAHVFINALIEAQRDHRTAAPVRTPARSFVLSPHGEAYAGELARVWADFAAL
ncbi:MAG TPA: extracellular solute-binding protein [Steroidobacteraceae bacterium]|nr:extracellular solute-binding protein [Steroidobacteraceae bacterium]